MFHKKKIFSISMVKNEMDIIESFVRYNTNIFDGMIILDNGSTDDTLKILNLLEGEGLPILVIEDEDGTFDKESKFDKLAKIAIDEFKADIIVPIDADEFLVSSPGENPREILEKLESPSYYVIDWKTYVPDFVNEDEKFIPSKITLTRDRSLEKLQKVIIPKELVKDYGVRIARGSHRILYDPQYESELEKEFIPDLRMAHFPIRSFEQTISKISVGWINALSSPERKNDQSFHWRKIFNCLKENKEIKNEDLTAYASVYSLFESQINEETKIELKKDPMDLSFCKDITLKYTPEKLNPMSNLLETCEELSLNYVNLKKEKLAEEAELDKESKRKKGISEYIKRNEKAYKDLEEIKYLFCEKKGSDKLIISFPGFTDAIGTFKYSYVRTLKNVNAHRLFILDDFGTRGCYLLGQCREFTVEKTVLSLIDNVLKKYNIEKENVILQGSSKGGWIALYYGIKYHFGHVIAGGPQTKIGRFLVKDEVQLPPDGKVPLSSKVNVADYVAGGHEEEDIKYLDDLLYDLTSSISSEDFPHIFIHVGREDFHYHQHVLPFTQKLDEIGVDYELDIVEYNAHNELAVYYPEYLIKTLKYINDSLVDEESKESADLIAQNSTLWSRIYELEYLTNKDRSMKNRLISRFPSLYILFNGNNMGIKNALINLKGYRAIKKNHLFNIGYYLKNYSDVRKLGADPLLHYLYYGYKEGRKPNPNFDGNDYLRKHSDVRKTNINPLVHYSLYGIKEERMRQKPEADHNGQDLYLEEGVIGGVLKVKNDSRPSLVGWLAKIGDENPREAVLKIDNHTILEVICDASDLDIENDNFMYGHGFKISIPIYFVDGEKHHIELFDKSTNQLICQDDVRISQPRSFKDFSGYLSNSIVSPMVHVPFREQDKRCFAVMENVALNLQNTTLEMGDFPMVSVVMYVQNNANTLKLTVESVLKQTYPNIEVLITDDASTDNSGELLGEINDERITLIRNDNPHGISMSRNLAVDSARGKYVAYLDPGNTWDPNYLTTIVGAFQKQTDAEAIYSGQLLFKEKRKHLYAVRFGSLNIPLLVNRNYININAFCHTRDVYQRLGGFNEKSACSAEWEWFIRLAESAQIYSVPVILSSSFEKSYSPENPLENEPSQVLEPKSIPEIHKGVSIIIPSYESLEDIKECIESILLVEAGGMLETIVVDNASSGPVVEYLQELADEGKIKLILNETNYGFTYAVNQGIAIARQGNDIVILNNDAVVTSGAIGNMQKAAYELPQCGLVVPQQVLPGGSKNINKHVPYANPQKDCDINPSGLFENIIQMPLLHAGRVLELNFAPFFCVYIRRDVLDSSVGLDAEFGRHYRSDRIFCNYIRHVMNLKIYYVSDAIVYHKEQQSTKVLKKESKTDFDRMFHKNQWDDKLAKQLNYKTAFWDRE